MEARVLEPDYVGLEPSSASYWLCDVTLPRLGLSFLVRIMGVVTVLIK